MTFSGLTATAWPCPSCEAVLKGATAMTGAARPPREGDLTVCCDCGAPLRFGSDRFHVLTAAEFRGLSLREKLALGLTLEAINALKEG